VFAVSRSRAFACAFLTLLLAALIVVASASAEKQTDVLGNNLSVPVVFSEGYNIVGVDVDESPGFRSTELVDNFDLYTPSFFAGVDGLDLAGAPLCSNWFYPQKTEATWQAEWVDGSAGGPVAVSRLDWGDSLLAKAWTARSKIRLEIRLYRENSDQLTGYAMNHLSGAGLDEVWGAADAAPVGEAATGQPNLIQPDWVTVYSNCARLSLYQTDGLGGAVIGDPIFSMPVADKYGTDGPTGFGAEINVGGFVLYGYTLDTKALKLAAGDYRVVFSLDESATWGATTVTRNAVITGLDSIDSAADSEWPFHSEFNTGGTASWVDFYLIAKSGGGKPK
jgi:hypothetical protein